MLKVKWSLLHLRMHLTIHKNAGVKVLLRVIAEPFILSQDPLEHRVDGLETFVGGVLVSVDFVFHGAVAGGSRNASHHVEEVGTMMLEVVEGWMKRGLTRQSCKHWGSSSYSRS